jgi:transposase
MNHRSGLDRSQTLLFPERLEDYIGPENPVRFLDAFVAQLDLARLGFLRATCADTGRPPYPPAVLLKIYLYGYLNRLRSSRRLETECQRNVELVWLTGKLAPDHKTIANFRKDHLQPLKAVAREFTLLCRKLDLFGGELLAIDGSKFKAVNAKDANFNANKLKAILADTDARLAEYFAQLDQADATETDSSALDAAQLNRKIAMLQAKKEWHAGLLAQLEQSGQLQISTTDPDTRNMVVVQGYQVGYNAQLAVDAKHKLIAADTVTNEVSDRRQLANVALQAKENLGLRQAEVLADGGYYTGTEIKQCVDHQLTPYVPASSTSNNVKLGLFDKRHFRFEAAKNVYVCPAGKELTYRFQREEKGRQLSYYRARGCRSCPLKTQCLRHQGFRTITREPHDDLMAAMAARLRAQPEKFALRKQLVEHPFGMIKRGFGYDHFLLKGLAQVQTEWSLITLVYNLKRVLKLVSFANLMAAVV